MEAGSNAVTVDGFTNLQANGAPVDTVQPVETQFPYMPKAEFFVNSFNINFGGGECFSSNCSGIVIWAFSNPVAHDTGGSAPLLTGLVVATNVYSLSPEQDEPGCTRCIATSDPRISATPVFNNALVWGGLDPNF